MPGYDRPFPKGTKRVTTGCQYCAVGCGYNAFLVPEDADPTDLEDRQGVSAFITPAMRNRVRYQGNVYRAAVAPDARCDLNKGNHSVRGGSQGENLVTPDAAGRSTDERLKSPQVRLADGTLAEIDWSDLNQVMAKLVVTAAGMRLTGRGPSRRLTIDRPQGLGGKVYEYQYLENTFAATKLFYSFIGTPNFAYHDRPSAAGSSPGLKDAGFRPHDFAYEDLAAADVVLAIGTNPYENQSVFFMQHLAGRQLIVLDPRRTATAQYAEETGGLHLQPSSLGADPLVLYALAREILERYHAEHGSFEMPLRLTIGDPVELETEARQPGQRAESRAQKMRRASRATDFAGFREFLGLEGADDTYTLATAAEVSGIPRERLAEAVSRLFVPRADPEQRPRVAILYEKGLIWGFNYHNTAAVASLGVLLGAVGGHGRLTGRVGGHQKGWAESWTAVAGVKSSHGEGYPFRNGSDTYSDELLRTTFGQTASIETHHNIDNHVFGPPPDAITEDHGDGRVTLANGLTTAAEPDVHLLWIVGGNYLGQTNDSQRKQEALAERLKIGGAGGEARRPGSTDPDEIIEALTARIDAGGLVVVHQEIFPNPTTEIADLVIPAAGWGEDSFCRYNAQRRLKLFERFQDMPLHAVDQMVIGGDPFPHRDDFRRSPKPDWMIFRDVAREVGSRLDRESGSGSFAGEATAAAFPWQTSQQVADDMATTSERGLAYSERTGKQSMLGDLMRFGEARGIDAGERLHTVLGWSRDGSGDALAPLLEGTYSVPGSDSDVHGNGVASNGVLLPVRGIEDGGQVTRLEGTLRVERGGPFYFVLAPWQDIQPAFERVNRPSGHPDEVALTNGRFNHLWNNLFHHLRNDYVNQRFPEDMPGTILEVSHDWAEARGLRNGQVVDVTAGGHGFRALLSRQRSVAPGTAFAMFSYPARDGGRFTFRGYVNNVTDGHADGINPIAALKYGRAVVAAAPDPDTGGVWIYRSATRLGPTWEERNVIADASRFDPRGEGPPPTVPHVWSRRQRLDWQMRELIVTKGLPRAFLSPHEGRDATPKLLDPDRFIALLAQDEVERGLFIGVLASMVWRQSGRRLDHWRQDEIAFVEEQWNGEEPIDDVLEIRLLPPIAIGRLGSSPEPMDNYDLPPAADEDHRRLQPAPTLRVESGRIQAEETPDAVRFRDAAGLIKPVAPFLEVWARFTEGGPLQPLTARHLEQLGLGAPDLTWRVEVANLKAFRRTGDPEDRIVADTAVFSDHAARPLDGESDNFKDGKTIPFGSVQYLEPSDEFPGLRLRFTPGPGKVYGPLDGDPNLADDVYDATAGGWDNHFDGAPGTPPATAPSYIYRGRFNSQTGRLISEGYLDDACDGIVTIELAVGGRTLRSEARITAGPPDFAPDSLHVRTLADDLEQMLLGPEARDPVPWDEVVEIMRRAFETVSLMATRAMNGDPGESNGNNMAGQDAGTGRFEEPIFDHRIPGQTDPGAVRGFHRRALERLLDGELPGFLDLLRRYREVADLSNAGRRKMPAMMRGSDGSHLALARRQRHKIEAAAEDRVTGRPQGGNGGGTPEEEMIALINNFSAFSVRHQNLDAGGGETVGGLFDEPPALLDFLRTGTAQGTFAGAEAGRPLVVPANPDDSAFVRLLRRASHPMHGPFSQPVPGTGRTGLEVVERWIASLS